MQQKQLRIDIISDSQKFVKELNKVMTEAKSAGAAIGQLGNNVDTSGITKASGKVNQLAQDARQARQEIGQKATMNVDSDQVIKKFNDLKGEKRNLAAYIAAGMSLGVDVGAAQRALSSVDSEISKLKKSAKEGINLDLNAKKSGGGGGGGMGSAIVGLGIGAAVAGAALKKEDMELLLMGRGYNKGEIKTEMYNSSIGIAQSKNTAEEYYGTMANYSQMTGQRLGNISQEEKTQVATMMKLLELRGYSQEEVFNSVNATTKQKGGTYLENLQQQFGRVSSSGFVDQKQEFFDNLAEYTQTMGKDVSKDQLLNIASVSSKLGLYTMDKAFDVNKEFTPLLTALVTDGTGGQLKNLNKITGKDFNKEVAAYNKGDMTMDQLKNSFFDKIGGNLTEKQVNELIANGFKMSMAEDIGAKNFVAVAQATKISKEDQAKGKAGDLETTRAILEQVTGNITLGAMSNGAGNAFMSQIDVGEATGDFKKNITSTSDELLEMKNSVRGLTDMIGLTKEEKGREWWRSADELRKLDEQQKNGTGTTNINLYGNPSVDEQNMRKNLKTSSTTGRDWLKAKGLA